MDHWCRLYLEAAQALGEQNGSLGKFATAVGTCEAFAQILKLHAAYAMCRHTASQAIACSALQQLGAERHAYHPWDLQTVWVCAIETPGIPAGSDCMQAGP
jgi:hypothetical protein